MSKCCSCGDIKCISGPILLIISFILFGVYHTSGTDNSKHSWHLVAILVTFVSGSILTRRNSVGASPIDVRASPIDVGDNPSADIDGYREISGGSPSQTKRNQVRPGG